MPVIEGAGGIVQYLGGTGAPTAGTDEIQTLTIDATGGTFKLRHEGYTTAAISWDATNNTLVANVDAALELLPSIGTGGVTTAVGTMTLGIGTLTLTFAGAHSSKRPASLITVADNSLTGTGTLTVEVTTPGVERAFRNVAIGTLLQHKTDGTLYIKASNGTWGAIT